LRIHHLEVPLYGQWQYNIKRILVRSSFNVIKLFKSIKFLSQNSVQSFIPRFELLTFREIFSSLQNRTSRKFPDRPTVSGAESEKAAKAQLSERCGSCAAGSAASANMRRWRLSSRSLSTRTCRPGRGRGRGRGRGSRLLGSAPTDSSKKCAAFSPAEVGRTNTYRL
jgi:hypothetical protein